MVGIDIATRVADGLDRLPARLVPVAEYAIGEILREDRQARHAAGCHNADLGAILTTLSDIDARLSR